MALVDCNGERKGSKYETFVFIELVDFLRNFISHWNSLSFLYLHIE